MTRVRLGEVVSIIARQLDPRLPQYASLPLINGENIESGTTRLLFRRTVASERAISPKYEVAVGDIVYSKLRPYLRKVVVADEPGLCSADLYPLRPDTSRVDPRWLTWLLVSEPFTRYARDASARARMPKLNREQLFAYRFDLPALDDQRRTAGRLTSQLAVVEAARSRSSEQAALAHSLRTRALADVFGGIERPPWEPKALSVMCEFVSDGTHQPPSFTAHGVPFLFIRNIVGGRIDFGGSRFVSDETWAELTKKRRPQPGDVLFSAVGSFGVAVVVDTDRQFIFQRHIAHVRLRAHQMIPEFLAAYLNSPAGRLQSDLAALGGAQRTVTLRSLGTFQVPTPPVAEQRRIVSKLNGRLAAIDAMTAAINAELKAIEALPAALLRRAFDDLAA